MLSRFQHNAQALLYSHVARMRDDELALKPVTLAETIWTDTLPQAVERGIGARRKEHDLAGINSLVRNALAHAFRKCADERGTAVGIPFDGVEHVGDAPLLHHAQFDGGVRLQVFHIEDERNAPPAGQAAGHHSQPQRRRNGKNHIRLA